MIYKHYNTCALPLATHLQHTVFTLFIEAINYRERAVNDDEEDVNRFLR